MVGSFHQSFIAVTRLTICNNNYPIFLNLIDFFILTICNIQKIIILLSKFIQLFYKFIKKLLFTHSKIYIKYGNLTLPGNIRTVLFKRNEGFWKLLIKYSSNISQ